MPDLSNPVILAESVALAAAVWAYFMLLCPALAKRAGVAIEEPPVWLYGSGIKGLSALTLFGLLAWSAFFQLPFDLTMYGTRMISLLLGAIDAALVAGVATVVAAVHLRYKAQSEASVIEPLTGGQIAARAGVVLAALAALAGAPALAHSFFGVDLAAVMLGDAPAGSASADLALALGLACCLIFFWVVPETIARRAEIMDEEAPGCRASGIELFRWGWTGLVVLACSGLASAIPGLEDSLAYPLAAPMGGAFAIVGAILLLLFYALPVRRLGELAARGDVIAREVLPRARALGILGLLDYRRATRGRPRSMGDGDEARLCATCLRPINDIAAYKTFTFDRCPHCNSFIPPVFTMLDFVKGQAARLAPLLEEEDGPPGQLKKKKRARTEDETRVVQDLLRAMLAMAVGERGTDVHLLVEGDRLLARCRTDGVLFTMVEFDKSMARPLISATKVLANLDIAERRKPQDGSFKLDVGARSIDVRVNTSPVADGESAAMRLLYPQGVLGSIDRLFTNPRELATMKRVVASPQGLLLVAGPTGSGKSTTLYNALESITNGQRNIITLEDPVEYQIPGLTQMQINPAKGFTFATGLRTILRQDPDVIMVGEIRDEETARMAIDAASTGHLVFSTLHSNDAVSTLARLRDLGIDSGRVADVALLFLAQRLMRLICERCARPVEVSAAELEAAGFPGAPRPSFTLRRGEGCAACHESGYHGREGAYEFLTPDQGVKELISRNEPIMTIRAAARRAGMRTLAESGLVKVLMGRSTLEELVRVTA